MLAANTDTSALTGLEAIRDSMIRAGVCQQKAEQLYLDNLARLFPHLADMANQAQSLIADSTPLLTPREIGIQAGGIAAIAVNCILVRLGYQERITHAKKGQRRYRLTDLGKKYANYDVTAMGGGYLNFKWHADIVEIIADTL